MRRPAALGERAPREVNYMSARAVREEVGPPSGGKVARMVREEVGLANGEQVPAKTLGTWCSAAASALQPRQSRLAAANCQHLVAKMSWMQQKRRHPCRDP